MQQLSFPFANRKCFEVHLGEGDIIKCSCGEDSNLLAIYFRMGQYNADDNLPNLIGFDCPFDDSPEIYACSSDCLIKEIREVNLGKHKSINQQSFPDIIVNASGGIERALYFSLARQVGLDYDADHFTSNNYSFGKENLEQLWEREKWRWINGG